MLSSRSGGAVFRESSSHKITSTKSPADASVIKSSFIARPGCVGVDRAGEVIFQEPILAFEPTSESGSERGPSNLKRSLFAPKICVLIHP